VQARRYLAHEGGVRDGVAEGALEGAGAPASSLVLGLEVHGLVVSGVVVGLVALGLPPEADAVALGALHVVLDEQAAEAGVVEGADILPESDTARVTSAQSDASLRLTHGSARTSHRPMRLVS